MRPTVKLYRLKLDLTKYIEEHHFVFDRVFDEATTNEGVSEDIANYSIVVPRGSPTAGICGLSGDKGHLLRIWPNGQWQNLHAGRAQLHRHCDSGLRSGAPSSYLSVYRNEQAGPEWGSLHCTGVLPGNLQRCLV